MSGIIKNNFDGRFKTYRKVKNTDKLRGKVDEIAIEEELIN